MLVRMEAPTVALAKVFYSSVGIVWVQLGASKHLSSNCTQQSVVYRSLICCSLRGWNQDRRSNIFAATMTSDMQDPRQEAPKMVKLKPETALVYVNCPH